MQRAKNLRPMTDDERAAMPADSAAWTPQQRRRYREDRLYHAAETLERRQLHNSLYRHAVRTGDKSGIHYYRVTALDTPTTRLRTGVVDAFRDLLQLDGMTPRQCARLMRVRARASTAA
jgi:hypothetical protein